MARVHRAAYSGEHFLARLPVALLADYYARFLGGGSRGVLAVRRRPDGGETLLGFAVFGRDIEPRIAAFKREQRAGILLAALGSPGLATRRVIGGLAARLSPAPAHVPAPALLLSIAVESSGGGVGRSLLEDMLRRSRADGETTMGLYVRYQNVGAINAYLRVGFRIVMAIQDQYYMECALTEGAPEKRS